MKKLFISCPMRGRKDEDIKESMRKMHKIAEIYAGEDLELIDTFLEKVVILSIKRDLPRVKIKKPVRVHFLWIEPNKKRDYDNVAFAKKFILDGMVKAGLIEGDSQAYVKGFADKFYIDSKRAGVEVEIKECPTEF